MGSLTDQMKQFMVVQFNKLFEDYGGTEKEEGDIYNEIDAKLRAAEDKVKAAKTEAERNAARRQAGPWARKFFWVQTWKLKEPKDKSGRTLSSQAKVEAMFAYLNWRIRFLACEYGMTFDAEYEPSTGPDDKIRMRSLRSVLPGMSSGRPVFEAQFRSADLSQGYLESEESRSPFMPSPRQEGLVAASSPDPVGDATIHYHRIVASVARLLPAGRVSDLTTLKGGNHGLTA